MSFSFSIRAAGKAEAKEAVAAELDKVVEGQPIHSNDRAAAQAAADAYIDLLADDDAKDLSISVNGYVQGDFDTPAFTGACIGVTANLVPKE